MNDKQKNLLYLNFATLLMAGPVQFAKLIDLPALSIIFGRAFFAVIALYLLIQWQKQSIWPRNGRDLIILLATGTSLAMHWVLLFHAVQISTVAVGIIAVNTQIIMIVLLEPLFFGERFSKTDLALGVAMFAGVLVLVPEFEFSNGTTQGVIYGVLSAFFLTIRNLVSRKFVRSYPATMVMGFQLLVVAAVLSVPALVLNRPDLSELFSWRMVLLGIVFTALLHTLYVQSLTALKAKSASLISVLQIPYNILVAIFLLAEYPPWRTLLGGIIVVGVVIVETARVKD